MKKQIFTLASIILFCVNTFAANNCFPEFISGVWEGTGSHTEESQFCQSSTTDVTHMRLTFYASGGKGGKVLGFGIGKFELTQRGPKKPDPGNFLCGDWMWEAELQSIVPTNGGFKVTAENNGATVGPYEEDYNCGLNSNATEMTVGGDGWRAKLRKIKSL